MIILNLNFNRYIILVIILEKKGFAISEDTINQEINTGLESFISTDLKTMQIGERFS